MEKGTMTYSEGEALVEEASEAFFIFVII